MALRTLATDCWGATEGQAWQVRDTPSQGPHCPMLSHHGQSGDKSVTRSSRWQFFGLNLGDKVPHQKEWATRERCASEMLHAHEWNPCEVNIVKPAGVTHSPKSPQYLWKSPKSQGRGEVYLSELWVAFLFIFFKKFNLCFSIEKVEQSVHTLG